jgi:hypothetical protein
MRRRTQSQSDWCWSMLWRAGVPGRPRAGCEMHLFLREREPAVLLAMGPGYSSSQQPCMLNGTGRMHPFLRTRWSGRGRCKANMEHAAWHRSPACEIRGIGAVKCICFCVRVPPSRAVGPDQLNVRGLGARDALSLLGNRSNRAEVRCLLPPRWGLERPERTATAPPSR